MNHSFQNNVVLITGAARGLGQHLALRFAQAGASVVITARDISRLTQTERMLKDLQAQYLAVQLDVTSYSDCEHAVQTAIKTFGDLSHVINNASGYLTGWDLRKVSVEAIENEINVTYRSVIYMTKAVLPHFLTQKHGTIITVSSGAGLMHSECNSTVYAADKSAVIRFSETMQKNLSPYGVRMCCVVPCSIRESAFEEEAVSYVDVAETVLQQCADGDNLAITTAVLEPRKRTI